MATDSLWVQVIRSSPAVLTLETKYVACTQPAPFLALICKCGLKPPSGAFMDSIVNDFGLLNCFANFPFTYETGNLQVPGEDTTSLSYLASLSFPSGFLPFFGSLSLPLSQLLSVVFFLLLFLAWNQTIFSFSYQFSVDFVWRHCFR